MKKQVLMALVVVVLSFLSIQSFAQAPSVGTAADYTFFTAPAPNLGTAADYVLFTTVGAVGNTGISRITGNVGTNSGAITIYVNVNGVLHTSDGASGQCAADLLIAYNQLNATIPTFFPAPLLGNGQVLNAGVYQITGAATLDNELILDAQNDPNAVFIIQIEGPFSTAANSKVTLVNGALACNVFWKIEGLVDMASGTTMRGTVIANNAAINLSAGVTLEGRALSTAGAVNVTGVLAYTPIGCGSPVLMGPAAPDLVSAACYAIFSGNGSVTNAGITYVTGDVGTNVGLTTGFNPLFVTGMIHPIPDGSTAAAAADLLNAYNFLNVIPYDIELMYPAQFGNNLVLTPHTYLLNAATTLTDTLYLNGGGQADAIFVIKIEGALSTSTYSKVILTNGTLPENVFWNVNGAVSINDYSVFKGTVIANNGTVNLATRVNIDGRAFSTTGAIETTAVTVTMPPGCASALPPEIITDPEDQIACEGDSVSFTVSATGTDLEYQWRKGLVDLADGGNIFGATSDELIINPAGVADAAADYNVVVSGTYPPAVTSENVSLTVETAPEITTQPTDQIASVGGSATFSVIASGDGLTYQWRKGLVDLADGGNISGATSEMLTINPVGLDDVASDYNVVITGNCPPDAISDNASLTISASPVIITEPSNQVVCENGMVSFSVVASGDGLTYQWRKGLVELTDGGNIFGATSDELIINPAGVADAAADYNVVVSGTYPPAVTSENVSLTVETAPEITTQPTDQIASVGGSATFSVLASGDGLTYQWRKGIVDLADGGNISGATSEMLTINPVGLADAALDYNVVITGNCAPDAISDNASLTISASPVIITQPSNQVVCEDGMVSFSVVASGDGLTYQ
ncbi:MAG: ice-binding family protein, partial [Bacteroidales bacterium]|nr:ice-binding family protein [Bacteroidales bacterium]